MSSMTVYAILVSIGIIMAVLLTLLLTFNITAFVILFSLYVIGISVYYYVYLVRNPGKKDDTNYNANKYISIYNMGLSGLVVLLTIIFAAVGLSKKDDRRW